MPRTLIYDDIRILSLVPDYPNRKVVVYYEETSSAGGPAHQKAAEFRLTQAVADPVNLLFPLPPGRAQEIAGLFGDIKTALLATLV